MSQLQREGLPKLASGIAAGSCVAEPLLRTHDKFIIARACTHNRAVNQGGPLTRATNTAFFFFSSLASRPGDMKVTVLADKIR